MFIWNRTPFNFTCVYLIRLSYFTVKNRSFLLFELAFQIKLNVSGYLRLLNAAKSLIFHCFIVKSSSFFNLSFMFFTHWIFLLFFFLMGIPIHLFFRLRTFYDFFFKYSQINSFEDFRETLMKLHRNETRFSSFSACFLQNIYFASQFLIVSVAVKHFRIMIDGLFVI